MPEKEYLSQGLFIDYTAGNFPIQNIVAWVNNEMEEGVVVLVAATPAKTQVELANYKLSSDKTHIVVIPQKEDDVEYYTEVAELLGAKALFVETIDDEPLFTYDEEDIIE